MIRLIILLLGVHNLSCAVVKKNSCVLKDICSLYHAACQGICEPGWHAYRDRCYWVDRTPMTKAENTKMCAQMNATLVAISELKQLEFLQAHTLDTNDFWLGATWTKTSFVWFDGRKVQTTKGFWAGDQITSGDQDNGCLTICGAARRFCKSPCVGKHLALCEKPKPYNCRRLTTRLKNIEQMYKKVLKEINAYKATNCACNAGSAPSKKQTTKVFDDNLVTAIPDDAILTKDIRRNAMGDLLEETPLKKPVKEALKSTLSQCLPGWTKFLSKCYYSLDKNLHMSREKMRSRCGSQGGKLVAPKSSSENEFIRKTFLADKKSKKYAGSPLWIDAKMEKVGSAKFTWSDKTEVKWFNWNGGKPQKMNDGIPLCVVMETSGKWKTDLCDNEYFQLCERDITDII